MGILAFLRGESVAMPPHADAATLSRGVEVLRDLILANRRREAERAERAEAERQAAAARRMEGGESGRALNLQAWPFLKGILVQYAAIGNLSRVIDNHNSSDTVAIWYNTSVL